MVHPTIKSILDRFQSLPKRLDDEDLIEAMSAQYKGTLEIMSEEELAQEFDSRIGNFYGDYDWLIWHKGTQAVIDCLVDNYEVDLSVKMGVIQ